MLKLALKTGDMIQIGDNIRIKLQSDSRAQLAIDAPREVDIKRITAANRALQTKGVDDVLSEK